MGLKLLATVCALFTLSISPVRALQTVSISSLYPKSQHTCITRCIYTSYYLSDLGDALSCGDPYANDCFCNTPAASVAVASSWLAACASSYCAAGDVTQDLTSMHYVYASYCINAGFTQPGASDWYYNTAGSLATGASPGQTAASGPGPTTTTQVTVVTQTAASTSGSSAAPQPLVTIHTTTTLLVNSNGSPVPVSSGSGPNKLALGIALGLGIPLVLMVAGVVLWLCWFRRRRGSSQEPVALPPATAKGPSSIKRKAVSSPLSQTSELTGHGVRRDLNTPEMNQLSPLASPRGENEMSGDGLSRELPGQPKSPPPGYSHAPHGQGGEQRWELG